jgi:hypothetical protein
MQNNEIDFSCIYNLARNKAYKDIVRKIINKKPEISIINLRNMPITPGIL